MRYDDDDDDDDYDYDDRFSRRQFRRTPGDGLSAGVIILIFIGVTFVIGAGVVSAVLALSLLGQGMRPVPRGPATAGVAVRSPARDRADAIDAFHNPVQKEVPPEVNASVKDFFDNLFRPQQDPQTNVFLDTVDLDRMVDELELLGVMNGMAEREKQSFRVGFKDGFRKSVGKNVVANHWTGVAMKKVRPLRNDFAEVVVYLRLRNGQGVTSRQRWWLRKRGDSWRWYDFESLDDSFRLSNLAASSIQGKRPAPWVDAMPRLQELQSAAKQQQWDQVEKLCGELEKVEFPPSLKSMVLMRKGELFLSRWQLDKAKALLDQAQQLAPDMPLIEKFQAIACNRSGEPDQALVHARKFLDLLGDDADIYHEMGAAHQALKQPRAAIDAFRKGLDDDPDHAENLVGLCQAMLTDPEERLTPARKTELAARMGQLSRPKEQVDLVLGFFVDGKEHAEMLETLLKSYLARVPRSIEGDYYKVRLNILKDEFAPACQAFGKLIARVADMEKRNGYVDEFLGAMTAAGKPVEGYDAAPDPIKAFLIVADLLVEEGSAPDLRALVERHAKKCPDDIWLPYYAGEVHLLNEEYAQAETEFAHGLAQEKLSNEEKATYQGQYIFAAHKAGHGLKAYETIADKKPAFEQLAGLMAHKPDAPGLAQLIDAHRKNDAADPNLPRWEAEVKWLEKDYDAVVQILTANRERILANENNQWIFEDRLIRGLAHLKRTGPALQELRNAKQQRQNCLLEAVIHALAGDLAKTEAALAKCVELGSNNWAFHNDPDLGPLLRSEPFKDLLATYPDPRPKQQP